MAVLQLNQLKEGQRGKIVRVRGRGEINRRLRDMGVAPGVEVEMEGRATLGDPLAVKIMGYRLSLRDEEARWVTVELPDGGPAKSPPGKE